VLLSGDSRAVIGGAAVGAAVGKMLLVGKEDEQPPAMTRPKMKRAGGASRDPPPAHQSLVPLASDTATPVSRVGMPSTAAA
jgi:hypothetical protein